MINIFKISDIQGLFPFHRVIIKDNKPMNVEALYEIVDMYNTNLPSQQVQGLKVWEISIQEIVTVDGLGEVYQDSVTIDTDTNINDNNAEKNTFNGTNICENVHLNVPNGVDSSIDVQPNNAENVNE